MTGLNAVGLIIYKDHWDFNTKPLKKTCSVEKGALQAMVTNKLKIAGLRILSNDELLSEPGSPLLVVHINTRGPTLKDYYITGQGEYAPSPSGYKGDCYISLWQEQFLVRNRNITQYGITWSGKMTEVEWAKTRDEQEDAIRNAVVEALNDFIVAHLAANPKSVDTQQR